MRRSWGGPSTSSQWWICSPSRLSELFGFSRSGATRVAGLPEVSLRLPALVAGAANLDMVFHDLSTTKLTWQRVDAAGSAIVPPVDLGSFPNLTSVAGVASGDDAVVLVPEQGLGRKLTVMRVQGGSQSPGFTFAHSSGGGEPRFVRRGSELIAAWIGLGGGCASQRISIARLTP